MEETLYKYETEEKKSNSNDNHRCDYIGNSMESYASN